MGTWVGQHLGWRAVFWIISTVGLLALAGVIALVPTTDPERDQLRVAVVPVAPATGQSLRPSTQSRDILELAAGLGGRRRVHRATAVRAIS